MNGIVQLRGCAYRLAAMATLGELFTRARLSAGHRRAKHLATADYRLILDLVRVRKARGLSQEDVAERLGISQQAVSKLERYDSDPKLSSLRRYAHAVEALVAHVVEADTGQLDRGEWIAVAYSTPSIRPLTSKTYATDGVRRTDLAPAA